MCASENQLGLEWMISAWWPCACSSSPDPTYDIACTQRPSNQSIFQKLSIRGNVHPTVDSVAFALSPPHSVQESSPTPSLDTIITPHYHFLCLCLSPCLFLHPSSIPPSLRYLLPERERRSKRKKRWKRNSFYVHVKMTSGMSWVILGEVSKCVNVCKGR